MRKKFNYTFNAILIVFVILILITNIVGCIENSDSQKVEKEQEQLNAILQKHLRLYSNDKDIEESIYHTKILIRKIKNLRNNPNFSDEIDVRKILCLSYVRLYLFEKAKKHPTQQVLRKYRKQALNHITWNDQNNSKKVFCNLVNFVKKDAEYNSPPKINNKTDSK